MRCRTNDSEGDDEKRGSLSQICNSQEMMTSCYSPQIVKWVDKKGNANGEARLVVWKEDVMFVRCSRQGSGEAHTDNRSRAKAMLSNWRLYMQGYVQLRR